jgi:hypothetical protein
MGGGEATLEVLVMWEWDDVEIVWDSLAWDLPGQRPGSAHKSAKNVPQLCRTSACKLNKKNLEFSSDL